MTYQANEEEKYQKCSAENSLTVHISISHRRHSYDEEVHASPIR